ncbi:SUMO-activating enzyme subunit 1A isoform X2 [Setaria italica]|uniref:SUMO-activating enzyme subunit 1A isoform X2 n=1 Tax=Setaria italica TaxID=4555 RepID=UPI0006488480|nr:SUMO-activating enzyme subunit 1A isoform X2 [Setaria italica]
MQILHLRCFSTLLSYFLIFLFLLFFFSISSPTAQVTLSVFSPPPPPPKLSPPERRAGSSPPRNHTSSPPQRSLWLLQRSARPRRLLAVAARFGERRECGGAVEVAGVVLVQPGLEPLSDSVHLKRSIFSIPNFQIEDLAMDGSVGGGSVEEELTAQETALYDRQIRVWGVDAQKRLSKAHMLVCGMNGTTIEVYFFCKNIVLAGVGSLSLMDDHMVTEDDLNANFLIPPDESIYGGRSRAEVCCKSLKDFNPMVRVSVDKGDPSLIDGEFLDKFDIVVVSCASLKTKLFINDNCRKRSKRIAFYTIDCKDSCGEIFVDLQKHSFVQKKPGGETEQQELTYPSLQETISTPWNNLPRKMTKLYFAMRVLERVSNSYCSHETTASSWKEGTSSCMCHPRWYSWSGD